MILDNSSVTSESQSIDINSKNSTNNVSNDCDSSIDIHNISLSNITLDNHFDSDFYNITLYYTYF